MREIGRDGLMEKARLYLGKKPDLVMFRCQSGSVNMAKEGEPPMWQTYGLARGASDLIGCLSVYPKVRNRESTQDISRDVCIFPVGRWLVIELKAPSVKIHTKKLDERELDQKAFIDLIKKFGGWGGFANSIEDCERLYLEAGGAHRG